MSYPTEDTIIDFDVAFGPIINAPIGRRISDPLQSLTPAERSQLRKELEDVIQAQAHGRSLGRIPRYVAGRQAR